MSLHRATCRAVHGHEHRRLLPGGCRQQINYPDLTARRGFPAPPAPAAKAVNGAARYKVVAYDYGIKTNILRRLASFGCDVTVVPADYPAEKVGTV